MRNRVPGLSGAPGSLMSGQRIFRCWTVRPETEYGNSMAEMSCALSSPPHRNAANTLASSRTERGRRTVRPIR
jgi:hypothetical protein